ncbi:MAG: hypothetical protein ACYDG5_03370, partial [Dehalococcoidales bacterium]
MAKGKYDKYITREVVKEVPDKPGVFVTSTRHLGEKFGGGHLSVDCIYVTKPHLMITQPHKHEFPQYIHFFSANPNDPRDFDAEIEITLGEEKEKHIVTTPAAAYFPAGLLHGPIEFKKVKKPLL